MSVLLRRAPIIILVTLLSAGAAAAFAFAREDDYESTAKLLFRQTIGPELNAQGLLPGAPDADNLAQNNVAMVDSRRVAEATAQELGGDISADDVERRRRGRGPKDSDVVDVVATAGSPERAAALANTYAETAADQAQADQRAADAGALCEASAGSCASSRRRAPRRRTRCAARATRNADGRWPMSAPAARRSSSRASCPRTRAAARSDDPPRRALRPDPRGGLALLREQMDRRLHHAAEVSAAFDAPVLTTVPRNRKLKQHVPFGELPSRSRRRSECCTMNLRFARGAAGSQRARHLRAQPRGQDDRGLESRLRRGLGRAVGDARGGGPAPSEHGRALRPGARAGAVRGAAGRGAGRRGAAERPHAARRAPAPTAPAADAGARGGRAAARSVGAHAVARHGARARARVRPTSS